MERSTTFLNKSEVSHTDMFDTNCVTLHSCEHTGYYIERIAYLETLVKKYKFDALTGLMMKHDFTDAFDRLFEEYRFANLDFCMAIIDVNGLHNINRINGYAAGDKILKEVADALLEHFHFDQIFRISGDEFVVLIRRYVFDKTEFKDKLQKIPHVTFVAESSEGYTSPKHMFKSVDRKLALMKQNKCENRV